EGAGGREAGGNSDRDPGQPPSGGPRGDPRGGRERARGVGRDQVPEDRRPPRGHPRRDRPRQPGSRGRDRGEGARDDAGHRREGASLRRPARRRGACPEMSFAVSQAAGWTGAAVTPPGAEALLSGVALDSRRARAGDLFVAVEGERVDGHEFASAAAAAGAGAVLAARRPEGLPADFPVLLAGDSKEALLALACGVKKDAGFRLPAVAGSVGQTTTKGVAAALPPRPPPPRQTPAA